MSVAPEAPTSAIRHRLVTSILREDRARQWRSVAARQIKPVVRGVRSRHLFVVDTVGLVLASLAALVLWSDTSGESALASYLWVAAIVVATRVAVDILLGLYGHSWWYANVADLARVLVCLACGTLASALLILVLAELAGRSDPSGPGVPHATFWLVEASLALVVLVVPRVAIRVVAGIRPSESVASSPEAKRMLVYGAGWAGVIVARSALREHDIDFVPVGFIDDDRRIRGRRVAGLKVFGGLGSLAQASRKTGATALLIAMPHSSGEVIRRAAESAMEQGLEIYAVPSVTSLADGTLDASSVRPLRVEDLVQHPPGYRHTTALSSTLSGSTIVITGAAGSIGSEVARQALALGARHIGLVDQAESSLYLLQRALQDRRAEGEAAERHTDTAITAHLVDVTDQEAMGRLLATLRPDVVIHAAGYKHVPILEDHPARAIHVNVGGASSVAEAAATAGVERFVLLSSHQAARPGSVVAATARLAEMVVNDVARRGGLAYVSVRFGNVLGSSGSVVPVFQDQLGRGGSLTVTDQDATRSFMTIAEAAWLVLEVTALADGPGLFVLERAEPIRVMDIATDVIRLAGKDPGSVSVKVVGPRKGETLRDAHPYDPAALRPTDVPGVLRFGSIDEPPEVGTEIRRLLEIDGHDDEAARAAVDAFLSRLPGYGEADGTVVIESRDAVGLPVDPGSMNGTGGTRSVAWKPIPVSAHATETAKPVPWTAIPIVGDAAPAEVAAPRSKEAAEHLAEERPALSKRDERLKRLTDIVLSSIGLAVLGPTLAAVAVVVRKSSPGPAFYRHRRLGRGGREFDVLKFRSMREAPDWQGPHFTSADDPRITHVGRFLRRYKIDELPQLWNVLKGDMSLVGPRPDVRGYMDRLRGREAALLSLRPGITGPATLYLREEERIFLDIEDRQGHYDRVLWPHKVRINLDYLEHWSFRRDIAFLAVTALPSLDRLLKVIPTTEDVERLARNHGAIAWWPASLDRAEAGVTEAGSIDAPTGRTTETVDAASGDYDPGSETRLSHTGSARGPQAEQVHASPLVAAVSQDQPADR